MKIACFSDTYIPELNGVATSISILVDQLRSHGHTVYVVTTKPSLPYDEDPFVIRLEGIELKFLYGYTLTSPIHPDVIKRIEALDLDLIHCHTEFSVGLLAHKCANLLHIPLVSTYHTVYEDYTHYLNLLDIKTVDEVGRKVVAVASKAFLRKSMSVIAPSEKTRDLLLRYGVKAPIHIIPTGLDLDRFSRFHMDPTRVDALKASYGLTDEKIILYVGRIAEEKSLDVVIDAFAKAIKTHPNYRLLIVGKGPGEKDILKQIETLALDDRIIYCGPKPRNEVPDYYHMADLFVSASLSETQGVTFIEALASQTPIMARHDEVLDGLLLEGETGYFFEDGNDFAHALDQFESLSEAQHDAMRAKCLEVTQPYSQEIFYSRVIEVYTDAIDRYLDCYILRTIKTKGECVLCQFESHSGDQREILITLEDYMEKGLRKGGVFTDAELDDLSENEAEAKAYRSVLKFLSNKDRTVKETYDYLVEKSGLSIGPINALVDKLQAKGYLDDKKFVVNAIYSMQAKLFGREKIKKTLKQRGISADLINMYLNDDEDDEFSKALSYSRRVQFTNMEYLSAKGMAKKLYNRLLSNGFSKEIATRVVETMDFSNEMIKEGNVCAKVAEKGRKLYKNKYSGSALRNRVFNYCLHQGFDYEDIYAAIDNMEWKDEQD